MDRLTTFSASGHLIETSGSDLPSRIELMPLGVIELKDNRGVVGVVTDGAALASRSMEAAKGGMLPIDFGHGMDGGAMSDPRAAGWITALSVDGSRIMADVEWTDAGAEALAGRMFRFISPTFTAPKGGGELGLILRAGLTNDPALPELALVASQQETPEMPEWLKTLAATLGMPDETDEAVIAAAAQAKVEEASHAAPIIAAAGLTGTLTQSAATAITAKITAAADVDPAQYVPMASFKDLSQSHAALKAQVAQGEAETLVASAMSEGKVAPAMETWAKGYAGKDPAGFKAWLASAPVLLDGATVISTDQPKDLGADGLSAEEKAICASAGVSEEAFLATKQGKAPAKKGA